MKKLLLIILVVIFACQYNSQSQVKRVLLEQFTGAWCGWCVDGSYVMEQLDEEYPDTFIGCKIHNGDSMVIAEEAIVRGPLGITGFPMGSVDRRAFGGAIGLSRTSWKAAVDAHLQIPAKADVQVSYAIIEETRQLMVTVYCTMLATVNSTLKFNAYVLEDSVSGTGTGWDQSNYLTNRAGYETNPYYKLPAKIVGYQHMKVVRAMLGSAWGSGTIPKPAVSGEVYTQDFVYDIPAGYKLKDIHVIGFVQVDEANNKEILNVAKGVIGTPELQLTSTGDRFDVKPQGTPNEKIFNLKNIAPAQNIYDIKLNNTTRTPSDWTGSIVVNGETKTVSGTDVTNFEVSLNAEETLELKLQITPGSTLGVGDVEMEIASRNNPDNFKGKGIVSCYSQEIENFEIISGAEAQYSIKPQLVKAGYNNFVNLTSTDYSQFSDKFINKNHVIWNTGAADKFVQSDVDAIIADIQDGKKLFICGNLCASYLDNFSGLSMFGVAGIGFSTQGFGSSPWRVWLSGVAGDPISSNFGSKSEGNLISYLINLMKINDVETTRPILHFTNAGQKVQTVGSTRDTTFIKGIDAIFGVRVYHENSRSVLLGINPYVIKSATVREDLINKIMIWLNNTGPELDLNFEELNYGYVADGQEKTLPVIIHNPGNEALTITEVTIDGMDSYAFTAELESSELPMTIQPNQYKNFMVKFKPVSEKDFKANLIINSNTAMNPVVTVPVLGYSVISGVEDTQYRFDISIAPNPTTDEFIIKTENIVAKQISMVLYNSAGMKIQESTTSNEQLAKGYKFDTSMYPSGIYYLLMDFNGEQMVQLISIIR